MSEAEKYQTKWQKMMESKKGGKEFNPSQSFALQVFWVVRSLTSAKEMMEKGFGPCSQATLRDTPTTLCYFFRISRDQSLAEKLKSEVKTIGQHPHYQGAFKSMEMGIPRAGIELKLRNGGVNLAPLDWNPNQSIEGKEKELDFDPIVLECTEIYLDDRSFYDHGASSDWMKSYPDIMLTCRSLKPKTYCLGNPSQPIWESTLLPSLKAIRSDETSENKVKDQKVKDCRSGLFFSKELTERKAVQEGSSSKQLLPSFSFFLEFDLVIEWKHLKKSRETLDDVVKKLDCVYHFVIPTNLDTETKEEGEGSDSDLIHIKVMMCFHAEQVEAMQQITPSFTPLKSSVSDLRNPRLIVYSLNQDELPAQQKRHEAAKAFLEYSGLDKEAVEIWDGHQAQKEKLLAGYPLHPLHNQIVADPNFIYTL